MAFDCQEAENENETDWQADCGDREILIKDVGASLVVGVGEAARQLAGKGAKAAAQVEEAVKEAATEVDKAAKDAADEIKKGLGDLLKKKEENK